ncbi:MAG: MoaD/ThiS family protein [Erysipelotrichaceae bacterium]
MIIKVYPGSMVKCIGLDEDGNIEVDDALSVRELLGHLKVPVLVRPLILISVNGMNVDRNYELKQGDAVSFMMPLAGG